MGKYLAGLVVAGAIAFCVKSAADDAGKKLAAVRELPPAAKDDGPRPGLIPAGDGDGEGDAATLVPFEDRLGFFTVMAPGTPNEIPIERTTLHGLGRAYRLTSNERSLRLVVTAEFVGGDAPNSPRETLSWIIKKDLAQAQVPATVLDRVKFSRAAPGAEAAVYEREWRGNSPHAHRTRHILVKKWLYTAAAHGIPDGLDGADVAAFLDTFAVTEKALDHPDGGALKP